MKIAYSYPGNSDVIINAGQYYDFVSYMDVPQSAPFHSGCLSTNMTVDLHVGCKKS